ncbi:MAG TPA: hypothetical protein PLL33_12135 [Paracoccus sp. (in: a-proteobacteria)]|nr:hypothetical protein [Paracoccus sp. (in: a-proteobacteria)]
MRHPSARQGADASAFLDGLTPAMPGPMGAGIIPDTMATGF